MRGGWGGSIYRPGIRTLHPPAPGTRGHCTPALAGHCGHRGLLMTLSRYVTLHMSRYVTLHVTLVPGRACCSAGVPSQTGPSLLPPLPGPPVCLYCTLYTVHSTVLYTLYTLHPAPGPGHPWPWRGCWPHRRGYQGRGEDGSTSVQVRVRCSRCVPAPLCTAAWQHRVGHHRPGVAGGWLGWLGKKL